jgi:dipeptidase E
VPSRLPQIITLGGGGFSMEPENPLLDDYILGLAGTPRPRVLFVATASGDSDGYIAKFHAAFPPERAQASHLPLFSRDDQDLRQRILSQDILYIGGGNTANLLAVWRLHGVDRIIREAWEAGIILAGISAGMICWFECSVTDSFGPLAALRDGLGLLPGSACPHYDGEAQRRPTYHRLIAEGLPAGYAADDGAALHFVGRELKQVVTSRPAAKAYRVERRDGEVVETALPSRYLGS